MARTRKERPIEYRDQKDRVWSVSEIVVLKVVSPSIGGPNLALVINVPQNTKGGGREATALRYVLIRAAR